MHNLKPDTNLSPQARLPANAPGERCTPDYAPYAILAPPRFCSPAPRRLGLEPGEPLRRLQARARARRQKKQRPPPLPPFPGCRIRPWGREYAVFGGNSRPVSEPLLLSLASNTRVGSLTLRQLTPATYGVQLIWYETSTNLSQTTDIRLRPLFTDNGYPTFKAFSRGLLFLFHRSDWYYPASKSVIVSFK